MEAVHRKGHSITPGCPRDTQHGERQNVKGVPFHPRRTDALPGKAIQVDGGSEFYAGFEDACREKSIKLYFLPPKSSRLNGHVERAKGSIQQAES